MARRSSRAEQSLRLHVNAPSSSDALPPGHTPRSHLLIKRQKSLLHGNSYEVREPLRLPNGTIKGNKLFAMVHKCTQKTHDSFKMYGTNVSRNTASEEELIGKVKSNTNGSEYNVCGGDATGMQSGDSDRHGRPQIAYIAFKHQGGKLSPAPGAMTVTLTDGAGVKYSVTTKPAVYNAKAKAYAIDFGSRQFSSSVVQPSSKNHQLEYQGEMVFQLIKVASDVFSLEYRSPLSAVQAVGIAMSRFGR